MNAALDDVTSAGMATMKPMVTAMIKAGILTMDRIRDPPTTRGLKRRADRSSVRSTGKRALLRVERVIRHTSYSDHDAKKEARQSCQRARISPTMEASMLRPADDSGKPTSTIATIRPLKKSGRRERRDLPVAG